MKPCNIKRIITFDHALRWAPVKILNGEHRDITSNSTFSWSFDGVCWTGWKTKNEYDGECRDNDSDFYLRITISDSLDTVEYDGHPVSCYSLSIAEGTGFNIELCDSPNLFQPYQNLDCALLLQQQLSDVVCCTFGIPCYYFFVSPDTETADYTFKEYVMHNIVSVKQLKLMISDGMMPSSTPKLSDYDFDWDIDWETEISKTQFANAFGDTSIPKERDFIYIPMMQRMWQVNSAYEEKKDGLMWRSTTWKLALTKYQDLTNYNASDWDDLISDLVDKTYDNTFFQKESNEQARQSGATQMDQPLRPYRNMADISIQDAIRKSYTPQAVEVIDRICCHHNNVVARNFYNFIREEGTIVYQPGICGDQGWMSFIICTPPRRTESMETCVLEAGSIRMSVAYDTKDCKYYIGLGDGTDPLPMRPSSTYLVIFAWDAAQDKMELETYVSEHRMDIPVYLLRPESWWFEKSNSWTTHLNHDYIQEQPGECVLHAYPMPMTNIKVFNTYMPSERRLAESLKYSTVDDRCVMNDLARPFYSTRPDGTPGQINSGRQTK